MLVVEPFGQHRTREQPSSVHFAYFLLASRIKCFQTPVSFGPGPQRKSSGFRAFQVVVSLFRFFLVFLVSDSDSAEREREKRIVFMS